MRPFVSALLYSVLITAAPATAAQGPELSAQAAQSVIRGRIVDQTGAVVPAARVTAVPDRAGTPVGAVTKSNGEFEMVVGRGTYTLRVTATGLLEALRPVVVGDGPETVDFTLQVRGLHQVVQVSAPSAYAVDAVSSATKTSTPLRDVPQSISIVTRSLIADQAMSGMSDVVRYMPGVSMAQGEGNRDTPVLRGQATTADFFVDGARDDVQYFRDLYNVERVEALKGPNAMIFGRGGVGGVLNRVTRQAQWGTSREATLQLGAWNNRRFTADVGRGLNETVALRFTSLYELSDSYRAGVGNERYGVNRRRRVLPAVSAVAPSGERRESVRHPLLRQRAQQHEHHAGRTARAAAGSDRGVLTPPGSVRRRPRAAAAPFLG